jgi:AhpC/TSA family
VTVSLAIGDAAPAFTLPDTDGSPTSLHDGEPAATVVVFTCNHCPYALAWHERLQTVARDYGPRGVRTLQINANDAARYPGDSPAAMAARVSAGEFAGPYLHDDTQEVAHAWGAAVTPDVYVLDRAGQLSYHGAPDADYGEESLAAGWLRDALEDVLAERPVVLAETKPVGCSIKWRG